MSYSKEDFRRDIVENALKKANNGDWFYKPIQIIDILGNIYTLKKDWPFAESTVKTLISKARNTVR